ncbi:MAG: 4Fe-4S binding protein [Candidatus Micrarchaeota archaeon]
MKFAIAKPGTTVVNKTGKWSVDKPKVDAKECIKCGICQNFCPEGIMGTPKEIPVIDLDYCKGCGICAVECPVKCIKMEREAEKR